MKTHHIKTLEKPLADAETGGRVLLTTINGHTAILLPMPSGVDDAADAVARVVRALEAAGISARAEQ